MERKLLIAFMMFTFSWVNAQFQDIDDPAFEDELIRLGHDSNPTRDGRILISDAEAVTFLNLTGDPVFNVNQAQIGLGIQDLTGIKAFASLEELWVQGNDLTELDLEEMSTLVDVRAFFNNLTHININGLTNLAIIGLNVNNLSGINVSTNTSLTILDIAQNNLIALDLRGQNALNSMNVSGNAGLDCILVADAATATAYNGNGNFVKNGTTTFSNTCADIYTQIPDRNFEQSLITQNYDSEAGIPNGLVLTADITTIPNLDISNSGVIDLTGLEAFTALETLNVSNNNLNGLELQNLNLKEIRANNCSLGGKPIRFQNNAPTGSFLTNVTTLELQNNGIGNSNSTISFGGIPNVTYLDISDNNFGTIDLSATPVVETILASGCSNLNNLQNLNTLSELGTLDASFCNISTINISQNDKLTFVNLSGNNLSTLNAAGNISLASLYASDNNLNTLDFPITTTFQELFLENNTLTSLNISTIDQNLFDFDVLGNPNLGCVQVSDVTNAQNQVGWQKENNTEYKIDCSVNTPFEITTSLMGAGTGPNYEINEGETFTINFNAGNTAINGDQYSPDINFSLNGTNTIEDFLINGNGTIPNETFTVISTANPDGSISILTKTDDFLEGDEVYIITINSKDNTKYTISEPQSFTVTVKDVPPSEPFLVTAYLSLPVGQPDNTIEEGQKFRIYFESDNSQYYNNQSFDALFNSTGSTALFAVDYAHEDSPVSFITRYQQDAKEYLEVEAFIDTDENENEEIVIVLQKDPNNNYAWENAEVNGEIEFRIRIEDIPTTTSDLFTIETTLSDNVVVDSNGDYTIEEGETISLKLNALPPATESYMYSVSYTIEGTTASSEDYLLFGSNPRDFVVQPSISSDGEFQFFINLDEFSDDDKNEKLVINLQPDPDNVYSWTGGNLNADGSLTYEFTIIDIPPTLSDIINVKFSNSGGIEGGTETFTVELFDSQGNPWSDHSGLEFELTFKYDQFIDSDIEYSIADTEKDLKGKLASADQVKNKDMLDLGSNPKKIIIEANNSSGNFTVYYEDDSDDLRDYYYVEISSTNTNFSFDNEAIQAVILDKSGQFLIDIYPGVNMPDIPADGTGDFDPNCCLEFSVEEGEAFEIYLDVEKGVPANERYNVRFEFLGDAKEGSDKDFTHTNSGLTIRGTVTDGLGPFDNRLIVNVNEDDIPNERGIYKIGEKFTVKFYSESAQYTIANQFFDENDEENDGNIEKISRRETFDIRIIDVIKITEFSASETKNIAKENPLENAEFEIELETANASGEDMRINFEIITTGQNSATPIADYQLDNYDQSTGKGYVIIPNGQSSAKIIVQPVNDAKFELDENVVIRLIEGNKYSITNLISRQIIIESDDVADYTATIRKGADNKSRESDATDFAEVIIELNEVPDIDVEVLIKISGLTDTENVVEGQDYTIFQDDKSTIISADNRTVLFKASEQKTKSIFIKALPDEVLENNESLWLALDSGVNYSIDQNDNRAEVELISSVSDTSSFDPGAIKVVAQSPRCPGNDQLGDIFLENDSPFLFDVTVVGLDGIDYNSTQILDKNDSADNTQPFDNLVIGSYMVSMKFKPANNADYPDVILPSYVVQIVPFVGMSAEEEGVVDKVISLTVAGSTSYAVTTNGKNYQFEFSDISENTIKIPLENGVNDLKIKGDSECKGILNKSILLNVVNVYPNPGKELVFVNSASLPGKVDIQLFDITGRLVYHKSIDQNMNSMTINVSALENGMYLGVMKPENQEGIEFKLIKN